MRKTKRLALASFMIAVLASVPYIFFSIYGLRAGMALLMQDNLYFINRNVNVGDKWARAHWEWKRNKNVLVTAILPNSSNNGGKFVIDFRQKIHSLLSSRSHLTLTFDEHNVLVKKEFQEYWRPFN